jgi:FkbM family methyltransferase
MNIADFSRSTLSYLPIEISVEGRKMRMLSRFLDQATAMRVSDSFDAGRGRIHIDSAHAPQRTMAYCFFNVLRSYTRSPLGRYMATRPLAGRSFVDVGANLGMYSLIAKSMGAESYAVEPEPAYVAYLRKNAQLIGTVIPMALSDQVGALPLYYYPDNYGATSLVASDGCRMSTDTVEVSTFSKVALAGGFGALDKIELIKIDVEGNEAATVAGMRDFFETGQRPAIWCEVRGVSRRANNSFRDVTKALLDRGYRHFDGNARDPLSAKVPTDAEMQERTIFDLLFVANQRKSI